MFLGHFATAYAAKRFAPRTSLGTLFTAAQLPDVVWPVLVLAGVEQATIAPGDTAFTPLRFDSYPVSHSLVTVAAWGAAFAAIHFWRKRRPLDAFVLAALVAGHWVLDFVSHRPDMPLWPGGRGPASASGAPCGRRSRRAADVRAGLWLALSKTRPRDRVSRWGFVGLAALLLLSAANGRARHHRAWMRWAGSASWSVLLVGYGAGSPARESQELNEEWPSQTARPVPGAAALLRGARHAARRAAPDAGARRARSPRSTCSPSPGGTSAPTPGVRHLRSLRLAGRSREGRSVARQDAALDVPFVAEAVVRLAFGRYDVVHAVEEAAHLVAPFARLLRRPARRGRGLVDPRPAPLLGLRDARAAALAGRGARDGTRCGTPPRPSRSAASLTDGVKRRAPGLAVFQVEDPPLVDRRDAARRRRRRRAAPRARARRRPGRSLLRQLRAVPGRGAAARGDPTRSRGPVPVHGRPPTGDRAPACASRRARHERPRCPSRARVRRRSCPSSSRSPTCCARRGSRARTRPSSSTPTWRRASRSWRRASRRIRSCWTIRSRSSSSRSAEGVASGPQASPGAEERGPCPRRARARARRPRVQRRTLPGESRARLRRDRAGRGRATLGRPVGPRRAAGC